MPTKTKRTRPLDHKRYGQHHRRSKPYKRVYWPYLPTLLVAIVVMVIAFLPRQTRGDTLAYAVEMSHENLLQATNAERAGHGAGTLRLNAQLSAAAQAKAKDMVARNYWSHETPDGKEPWVFIQQAGYRYYKAGENLAYGFSDSATTVKGWMNSQTHRDNLLDAAFTEVGFGFANAQNYQNKGEETIIVAMYGRPESLGAPTGVSQSSHSTPANTSQASKAVPKISAIFGDSLVWAPFAIGVLSGGAAAGLLVNHSLRLRKFIRKSERYFVAHPLLDISFVIIAVSGFELTRTVGFIY